MYIPKPFEQNNIEAMHDLMQKHPLATVVSLGTEGIYADHIPLHLSPTHGIYGALHGHVARANPFWRDHLSNQEVLAIFHGPDAYISPSWYATKQATGKVVPTWNYTVVHAYCNLRIVEDPIWIRRHLEALTDANEAIFPEPWSVNDAPIDFTEKLIEGVVGVELLITRLSGKWKLSQNQLLPNRAGVVQGLKACRGDDAVELAALIEANIKK